MQHLHQSLTHLVGQDHVFGEERHWVHVVFGFVIFQVLLSNLETGTLRHAFANETPVEDGAKRVNVAFFVDSACVKFDKIDYYLATCVDLAILLQSQVS